jgi:hypothetical protein
MVASSRTISTFVVIYATSEVGTKCITCIASAMICTSLINAVLATATIVGIALIDIYTGMTSS